MLEEVNQWWHHRTHGHRNRHLSCSRRCWWAKLPHDLDPSILCSHQGRTISDPSLNCWCFQPRPTTRLQHRYIQHNYQCLRSKACCKWTYHQRSVCSPYRSLQTSPRQSIQAVHHDQDRSAQRGNELRDCNRVHDCCQVKTWWNGQRKGVDEARWNWETAVALTAQLEQINLLNKKLQKKIKDNKMSSKDKKKDKKKKDPNSDKWKWKEVPPKSGQKETKVFKGETYYWCPHHKKWTLHNPDECHLKDKQTTTQKQGQGTTTEMPLSQFSMRPVAWPTSKRSDPMFYS